MDSEDYRESAELFVTLAPGLVRDLRAFTMARDLARLRILAHRLVGTVGFFDPEGCEAARRLEEAAADGRVDELQPLVDAVDAELSALVSRLTSSGASAHGRGEGACS